jgi:hypothetical protein
MRSVLRQGHRLTLFSYDPLEGVPGGVEQEDAATILPRSAIVRHNSGSTALFANWFRYELQRLGRGIWLDSDVYLLAPLNYPPHQHVFGWESDDRLGNAVLQLPPGSPLLAPLIAIYEKPYVPPWIRLPDRVRAHWRQLRDGSVDLGRLPWGVAGPLALTALSRRFGLLGEAQPRTVFYPYHYSEATWIFDPAISSADHIRPETAALHLYNRMISARKNDAAAPGSFFDRLQQEGA